MVTMSESSYPGFNYFHLRQANKYHHSLFAKKDCHHLFILITPARLSFRIMAVTYTGVSLHLEVYLKFLDKPSIVYSSELHF